MVTTFIFCYVCPSIFLYFMLVVMCVRSPCLCVLFVYQGPGPFFVGFFLPQIVAGQACVGPVFVEAFAAPVRPWRSEVFTSRSVTAGAFRSAGSSLALGAFRVLSAGYPVYVGGFAAPVRPWRSESSSGGRSLSIVLRPRPAV